MESSIFSGKLPVAAPLGTFHHFLLFFSLSYLINQTFLRIITIDQGCKALTSIKLQLKMARRKRERTITNSQKSSQKA